MFSCIRWVVNQPLVQVRSTAIGAYAGRDLKMCNRDFKKAGLGKPLRGATISSLEARRLRSICHSLGTKAERVRKIFFCRLDLMSPFRYWLIISNIASSAPGKSLSWMMPIYAWCKLEQKASESHPSGRGSISLHRVLALRASSLSSKCCGENPEKVLAEPLILVAWR